MSKITAEVMTVTPEYAGELLSRNTMNRPLDKRRAARLAEAIKRGEWKMNGDTIRVSETGVLLDGQHRLTAIVMSGRSVQTMMVFGLPDEVFSCIDTNRATRTTSNVLAIEGVQHYVPVASIARLAWKHAFCGNPFTGSPEATPTTEQIMELLRSAPQIHDIAASVSAMKWCRKFLTLSIAGFCMLEFSRHDRAMSEEFFRGLESGSGLGDGSPILLLRDRIISSYGDKEAIKPSYKCALVFKAFRLFCDGASVKALRVRTNGDTPERDLFKL